MKRINYNKSAYILLSISHNFKLSKINRYISGKYIDFMIYYKKIINMYNRLEKLCGYIYVYLLQ